MGWIGLGAAVNWAAQGWSATDLGAWLTQWTWLVPLMLVPLVLTRFPKGHVPPGRWKLVEKTFVVLATTLPALLAIAALGAPRTLLVGQAGTVPEWTIALIDVSRIGFVGWSMLIIVQLVGVVVLSRTREGADKGQLVCLSAALLATLLGIVGVTITDDLLSQSVVALALPVGISAAVLRYALYDLDLLVHRLPVWISLTVVVAFAVGGTIWLVTELIPSPWNRVAVVLVLTALVLLLDPLRRILQRGTNRLLYGHRDTPAEALAALGEGLGSATAQHSAQELCRSVANTLALPWVGLLENEVIVADWGRRTSAPLAIKLTSATTSTQLLLCPRRVDEQFTKADLRVVQAMASQVSVAVRALAAADDLQRAREQLVRTREDERKRLRDDLHDGLGPALVGIRFTIRALIRGASPPPRQLEDELADCSREVTRLVEGLRPPALDHGLLHSLRSAAERWTSGSHTVRVDEEGFARTDGLPAAVEIAAYRIVMEAVSNALRHAQPETVTITASLCDGLESQTLVVRVIDDGSGNLRPRPDGIGMISMRDRAEELGGKLLVDAKPGEGTVVEATIPVRYVPPTGSASDAAR